MTIIYQFSIPDVTCSGCTGPIEKRLKADFNAGYEYNADPARKTLNIIVWEHEAPDQEIGSNVCRFLDEEMGVNCVFLKSYPLNFKTDYPSSPSQHAIPDPPPEARKKNGWERLKDILLSHWFQGGIGTLAGLILLILSIATGGLPLAAMIAIGCISSILTFLIGFSTFKQAYFDIFKSKKMGMDTLFALSTLVVVTVSIAAFFVPWLSMMFEAALLILGFRHIGQGIKNFLTSQLITARAFQDDLPAFVQVYEEEQLSLTPLEEVVREQTLYISEGEIIPLDGICLTDGVIVFTTCINGNPFPRRLKRGESLLSGMRLTKYSAPLFMRVTEKKENSHLAHMDFALKVAEIRKAPIQQTADRIMQYFIPTVFAVSAITGLVIGLFFPPALAIQCAISVLVSACPCILGLVVPTTVLVAMKKAAEHGVQFVSPESLELASKVNAVVFDLHGTLTTGVLEVEPKQVTFIDPGCNQKHLFSCIAALEKNSQHFIGEAVFRYTASFGEEYKSLPIGNFKDSHHSGISGIVDGDEICIGNEDFMKEQNISMVLDENDIEDADSIVYVAVNGKLSCYFKLTDPLRENAKYTLKTLQENGIEVFISTGACEKTANRYGKRLNIPLSNIRAGRVALAGKDKDNSKSQLIKELKAHGKVVAMIGDAANDSIAVTDADFGVGVQSNSSHRLTLDKAGAIVQSGSMLPFATIFILARQTMSNITQNLYFTLGYNLLAVLLTSTLLVAAGFVLNPGIGAGLMILQMSLVFLNLWRFKQQTLSHLRNTASDSDSEVEQDSYVSLQQTFKPNDLGLEEEKTVDAEMGNGCGFSFCRPQRTGIFHEQSPAEISVKM